MTDLFRLDTRWHIAYNCRCPTCSWHGMVATAECWPEKEIWAWFSCPSHGQEMTDVKMMDTRQLKDSIRRGRG